MNIYISYIWIVIGIGSSMAGQPDIAFWSCMIIANLWQVTHGTK